MGNQAMLANLIGRLEVGTVWLAPSADAKPAVRLTTEERDVILARIRTPAPPMVTEEIARAARVVCDRLVCNGDCVMTSSPDRPRCNRENCRVYPVVEDAIRTLTLLDDKQTGEGNAG